MDLSFSEIWSFLIDSTYVTLDMDAGGISFAQILRFTRDFDVGIKVKAISLIASFIAITIIVLLILTVRKINKQAIMNITSSIVMPKTQTQPGSIMAKWEEIMRHINSNKELEWKFAVIEADKLLDGLFKSMGYSGESMGERLMGIDSSKMTSINYLWEAHKIRNKIVHEDSYFLRYAEAKRAIDSYRMALEELQAIT